MPLRYYLNCFRVIFSLSEYADEATMIPKNTSVLIRRIPGRPRKPIVTEPEEYCLDLWLHTWPVVKYFLIPLSDLFWVNALWLSARQSFGFDCLAGLCQMKMVRSYQQTYIEIEMFIQFCRSKAAENVVEVTPVASGFLGDSSMKYVRMSTYMPYSWRNWPLELH